MAIPNICSAKQGNDFESADLKFKHTHLFQSLDAQIKAKKISEFRTQTLQPPSPDGGCFTARVKPTEQASFSQAAVGSRSPTRYCH